jgi:hypothetical protein
MIRRSSLRGSGELRLSGIDDYVDKVEDVIRILNYVLVIKYSSEIPLGFEPAAEPLGVRIIIVRSRSVLICTLDGAVIVWIAEVAIILISWMPPCHIQQRQAVASQYSQITVLLKQLPNASTMVVLFTQVIDYLAEILLAMTKSPKNLIRIYAMCRTLILKQQWEEGYCLPFPVLSHLLSRSLAFRH